MTIDLYNSLKSVPKEYLKEIQAGRLKGMTDIKPQWRIMKLTEVFGTCGFGWKIQNLRFEYQKANDNEIVCNCYLEFLYKQSNTWSDPIPGVGGSRFSTMEKNGVYVSDEAEKMAYTDAISVATKMIGLAGDVYMGHGGKYTIEKTEPKKQELTAKTFEKMIEAIRNGEKYRVKAALPNYQLTEQQQTAIDLALKNN